MLNLNGGRDDIDIQEIAKEVPAARIPVRHVVTRRNLSQGDHRSKNQIILWKGLDLRDDARFLFFPSVDMVCVHQIADHVLGLSALLLSNSPAVDNAKSGDKKSESEK